MERRSFGIFYTRRGNAIAWKKKLIKQEHNAMHFKKNKVERVTGYQSINTTIDNWSLHTCKAVLIGCISASDNNVDY